MPVEGLTIVGWLDVDKTVDYTALPHHLADCLSKINASVTVETSRIRFESGSPAYMTNTWNPLSSFGFGMLNVNPATWQVNYCLSFRRMLVVNSVVMGILACLVLLDRTKWSDLLYVPLLWLFLVGGNLAIGHFKLRRFLRNSISSAPRVAV